SDRRRMRMKQTECWPKRLPMLALGSCCLAQVGTEGPNVGAWCPPASKILAQRVQSLTH
ncbi:Forkhead box protein P3, partial [Clarias magur]